MAQAGANLSRLGRHKSGCKNRRHLYLRGIGFGGLAELVNKMIGPIGNFPESHHRIANEGNDILASADTELSISLPDFAGCPTTEITAKAVNKSIVNRRSEEVAVASCN
jgi:hypothetical protein